MTETLKAKANEKLREIEYSQKMVLLSQHAAEFTIKGLKTLLRSQKAQTISDFKRLENKLQMQEAENKLSKGDFDDQRKLLQDKLDAVTVRLNESDAKNGARIAEL